MNENFYKNLLESLHDGVCFRDMENRITFWNKGAEELTGYKRVEIVGKSCSDGFLAHMGEDGEGLCHGKHCPAARTALQEKEIAEPAYIRHKEGHRIPVFLRARPIRDAAGKVIGSVEVISDNTAFLRARRRAEDYARMALTDTLTEVHNRRHIESVLKVRLDEFHNYGLGFGILFMDANGFKKINDRFGHGAGDQVLRIIGRTLAANIRPFDTVGRWGGDEFVAIINGVDERQLKQTAERFQALVGGTHWEERGETVKISLSTGATLARHDDTAETLIRRADELMYKSKALSGQPVAVG